VLGSLTRESNVITGATEVGRFQKSQLPTRFDVPAPRLNPLVASASVSARGEKDAVALRWGSPTTAEASGLSDAVLDALLARARRQVSKFPDSSRLRTNLALALMNAGRLEEAACELTAALAVDPDDYVSAVALARVQALRGELEQARTLYERVLARHPGDQTILASLAYIALQLDDHARAEALLSAALSMDPEQPLSHFLLGVVRLRKGDGKAAIRELRAATRLDVRRAVFHQALGVAYALGEDYVRAERSFRAAFTLSPSSPAITYGLCRALIRLSKADEAAGILKPLVERHPDDLEARRLLALSYLELQKYANARSQLEAILTGFGGLLSAEERARISGDIAATFLFERNLDEAEPRLRRAIEIDPRASALPYENLARLHMWRNEPVEALAVLNRAADTFPERQMTRALMSSVYARLDRFADAIAVLRPLYESGNAIVEVYAGLSWAYSWTGDLDSALEVSKPGYSRFRKVPGMVNNLAYTYLRLGQVAEARSVLKSLPRHAELGVELTATRGLLRLWEQDLEDARELYLRASEMASQAGDRDLARRVRQKMHLELARFFVRTGDTHAARRELRRGMAVRVEGLSYTRHLEQMEAELSAGLPISP